MTVIEKKKYPVDSVLYCERNHERVVVSRRMSSQYRRIYRGDCVCERKTVGRSACLREGYA